MNLTSHQAILLVFPWVRHFILGGMAISAALVVIGLQYFITAPYPPLVRLLAFIGWTQVSWHGMKMVAGVSLAIAMLVTGHWKEYSALYKGGQK